MIKKITLFLSVIIACIVNAQLCTSPVIRDSRGNDNVVIECGYPFVNNTCVALGVDLPVIKNTNNYVVSGIDPEPVIPYNQGSSLDVNGDDLFVKSLDLPFQFCFFGSYYNKVVVGTNGMISFKQDLLNTTNYPNINAPLPSNNAPSSSIFGVFQDLIFPVNDDNGNPDISDIYYDIVGEGFCRKFVISYYQVRVAGCDYRVNSQIVLHEGTNVIEVFTDGRPLACPSSLHKEALIGIQNQDATMAYTPPGRNTGFWSTGKEAWRFSPNGAEIIPQIKWLNDKGEVIGNQRNVNVCPSESQVYSVEATYDVCGSKSLVITDTINVDFSPNYPLAKDYNHVFCETQNSITINIDDLVYKKGLVDVNTEFFKYTYYASQADALLQINQQQTSNVTINGSKIYYVRVEDPTDPTCFRIAKLSFEFVSNILKIDNPKICDVNNDGVENDFILSKLNSQLFNNVAGVDIKYFTNQANANANENDVRAFNIVDGSVLWVRVDIRGCVKVFGPITVGFNAGPNVVTPFDYTVELCDLKGDKIEELDFHLALDSLIVSDPSLEIKYFSTLNAANVGTGTEVTRVREGLQKIYARVNYPDALCYSIIEINLEVIFKVLVANNKEVHVCFDGAEDVTVNLTDLSLDMLVEPLENITVKFFENEADADLLENELDPIQLISDDGNYVAKRYIVRFDDPESCYVLRKLTVTLVSPFIQEDNFLVCDFGNNNEENIVLSRFNSQIIGSQNATVKYFSTRLDAQNDSNAITSLGVTGLTNLYVSVTAYGCVKVFPITINLTSVPVVNTPLELVYENICDNNNDGVELFDLTNYQSQIYPNTSEVIFTYYRNYNPSNHTFTDVIDSPESYNVGVKTTVYVKVEYKNGGCNTVGIINFTLNFKDPIVLKPAVLRKCDFQQDLAEVYNLDNAIPQWFNASENTNQLSDMTITYHTNESDALLGISNISNLQTVYASRVVFYVRFFNRVTGCFSVSDVVLNTLNPPKALPTFINICDNNLNGINDIDLLSYRHLMIDLVSGSIDDFSFAFYRNQAMTDLIDNPENYEVASLPASVWVKIENIPGCFNLAEVKFMQGTKVSVDNTGPFVINDICDTENDGKETVNLKQFEAQISSASTTQYQYYPSLLDLNNGTNEILDPAAFAYDAAVHTTPLAVKVSSQGFCPVLVEILVQLKTVPKFTLPDYYFCPGQSVRIDTDLSSLDVISYQWINPEGAVVSTSSYLDNVDKEGFYALTIVASNGCSYKVDFNVYVYEVPVITQLIPNGNSYTVMATGSKTILYSINGVDWQTSNVFLDLPPGVVSFYVKFQDSECLGVVKKGLVVKIINTLTPNGDGYNDVWYFRNLDVFDGNLSDLKIFDRYGVIVYNKTSAVEFMWDGKFAGRVLPTSSYWYVLTLPDGRVYKDWIFLKNR